MRKDLCSSLKKLYNYQSKFTLLKLSIQFKINWQSEEILLTFIS